MGPPIDPSWQRRLGIPSCGPHSWGPHSSGAASGGSVRGAVLGAAAEPGAGGEGEPPPGDDGWRPHAAAMQTIQTIDAIRASFGIQRAYLQIQR